MIPDLDDELMQRCQAGDIQAFDELVTRHRVSLLSFASRVVGDRETAEDLVQETFIRMFRAIPRYKVGKAKFTTWMYRILSNLCKNELRNRGRRSQIVTKSPPENGQNDYQQIISRIPAAASSHPDCQLERKELHAMIEQAISELPPKYRIPLALRDIQDLSYEEIAKIVKIPMGTVKSRINRARQTLQERLKPYLEAET